MKGVIKVGGYLALVTLLCVALPAAVITDLNNTGDSGPDLVDDNWGVTPGVTTDGDPCGGADLCDGASAYVPLDQAVVVPFGFTDPWYTGDSSISKWITPGVRSDGSVEETSPGAGDHLDFGEGTFIYSTTFNIDGPFAAASISGLWWADGQLNWSASGFSDGLGLGNCGIYVNDVCAYDTFVTVPPAFASSAGQMFTLTSGFIVGDNELRFVVLNGFHESGLRVTFTETSISEIPEPATYLLIGGGLAAVALLRRRRAV